MEFNKKLLHHDCCESSGCGCEHHHHHEDEHDEKKEKIFKIIQLIIGFILFGVAFVLEELEIFDDTLAFYKLPYFYIYVVSYLILGFGVVKEAIEHIFKGKLFDENFLMSLATITAFCIKEYHEAVMVMLLYQIGEFLQDIAVDNSHRSVRNLLDMKEVKIHRIENEQVTDIQILEANIDDIILVKPGERIPLDGVIIEGKTNLDMSSLTGESLPILKEEGNEILSGSINLDHAIKIKITKPYNESTVNKILECIEDATMSKTKSERFITKFCKVYTPIVVGLALLVVIIPWIMGLELVKWIETACKFLVVSCPCALVISVPLAYFIGIGASSKKGVLMKGSNYLEMLDKMNVLLFDKTGTLTKGSLNVIEASIEEEKQYILELASCLESYSNHPIAKALKDYVGCDTNKYEVKDFKENIGYGVEGIVDGKRMILSKTKPEEADKATKIGSVCYITLEDRYRGYIVARDVLKDDAHHAVNSLHREGIQTVMVSGDTKENAEAVGKELEIDNVHSELLPTEKVDVLDSYLENKDNKTVGFVGDGINDAPSIAKSDIGIAMGAAGSDAAIEVSDVVIMNDSLTSLINAKEIARKTIWIVKQNIVMIIAIKAVAMIFALLDAIYTNITMPMWLAVLSDVGVCLLAILNSLRLFKYYKK